MNTTTRNADLGDFVGMLREQNVRKHDIVVPATSIRSEDATLIVSGAEPEISPEGVTTTDGRYVPTKVCDEGIAAKLDIPRKYLGRMRDHRTDLYDANVNGWLHGALGLQPGEWGPNPDQRSFLLRTFKGDDGEDGIARALLSDTYKPVDHLDVLMATLAGIREAGVDVVIDGADLTDRRMQVRVVCKEVQALAPTLLKGYRSPFSGAMGDENPTVFAGFVIGNSEVGNGAYSITPRIVFEVCNNGLTIAKDALRKTHLGSRLEKGVIDWSDETQQRNLDLVKSQTVDAVRTFVDVDYMTKVIEGLERKAEEEVATPEQVKDVTKACGFTEDQMDLVLADFIRGGQTTRGGVAAAITASAQRVDDGDVAAEMEAAAFEVLA